MKIKYKGRIYKVKENVIIRIQGILLISLGVLCYKTDSDGAALFFYILGGLMLFPNIGIVNRLLYKLALKVVRYERRKGL